ncbi:MAG: hypothetical protein HQK94_09225 [Nitrospirae bacterium]|nr:hypothetical protein [Nitrospirota bacterium]
MTVSLAVFSSDEIRGSVLYKAFEKSGYEPFLYRNILNAPEVVKEKSLTLLVLDTVGYFVNELIQFGELVNALDGVKILIVASDNTHDGIVPEGVQQEWCIAQPFDPMLVVSKAEELLRLQHDTEKAEDRKPATYDQLQSDLKRFLNIK